MAQDKWGSDGFVIARGKASQLCLLDRLVDTGGCRQASPTILERILGETRVDLHHLLEDLRDAYPGALEETILTEVVANSLDSGATCLRLKADPASSTGPRRSRKRR